MNQSSKLIEQMQLSKKLSQQMQKITRLVSQSHNMDKKKRPGTHNKEISGGLKQSESPALQAVFYWMLKTLRATRKFSARSNNICVCFV